MQGLQTEHQTAARDDADVTPEEAVGEVHQVLAGGTIPGVLPSSDAGESSTASASEQAYDEPEAVGEALGTLPPTKQARALQGLHQRKGPAFANEVARQAVPRPAARVGKDRTEEFNDAMSDIQGGNTALPADAANYVYVLIPGLMCNIYPMLGVKYMEENEAQLKGRGLDVRVLRKMNTLASVKANAKYIRGIVEGIFKETGKKVVLVGHSKGGVDASAAISIYDEIRPHVRAVVTMQAPMGGAIPGDIAPVLGPGLWDLSHPARKDFVKKHPYVANQVAMLNFATRDRPGSAGDGLVLFDDQRSEGADLVSAEGMDHGSTAMGVPANKDKRGPLTEALVAIALRQAAEMDAERAAQQPQTEQDGQDGQPGDGGPG